MTLYTFRLLDPAGSLHAEVRRRLPSDDAAIDGVEGLGHPDVVEVWDAERLVANFPARGAYSFPPSGSMIRTRPKQ